MSEDQLKELYHAWWKDSFGTVPNAQNTLITVSWSLYLLEACRAEAAVLMALVDRLERGES
jgi:hypothetical protein